MSWLDDTFDFDKFWTKDIWSGIKKDPERVFIGAIDPLSSWGWSKVTGKDYEPLVDQMGGPYGGKVISMGNPEGGVYGRAREAGVNTKPGSQAHDAAHIITAAAMGGGALNGLGGGGAQGAQPGLWNQGFAGTTGFSGAPYGSAPAQGIGGIAGPVGGGTGASASASLGPMDYAKLGMQAMPQQQQQPQQQPPPPPVRTMAPPVPTFAQRFSGGLGRVGEALFPVDPNSGMSPEQTEALRKNAIIQMGLGMMASSGRGAGFGESLASGYGLAQGNMQGRMQKALENAAANRAETRAMDREKRDIESDKWTRERQQQRDLIGDTRATAEFDYRGQQDTAAQGRWKAEQDAMAKWRQDQLANRGVAPPSGYRLKPDGNLEAIPGGPADPSGLAARKGAQSLRKEFRGLQSVKDFETVLPLLSSVRQAPDTPQGDLQVIYTVGKVLDPGSVVREGELQLTLNAAPWLQKAVGEARAQLGQGGRLTPEMRKGLVDALNERVLAYRQAYDRDFNQYKEYATESSLSPDLVVGSHATSAYTKPAGRGLGQAAAPAARKSVGGRNYVQVNGQWYEDDGITTGQ